MKRKVSYSRIRFSALTWSTVVLILVSSCKNDKVTKSSAQGIQTTPNKGALLSTDFTSLDALKEVIQIEYTNSESEGGFLSKKPAVHLTQWSQGKQMNSILKSGVSENDFARARDGDLWNKVDLAFHSPYFIRNRNDLLGVYILARRDFKTFGESDVAFYDLAETMKNQIVEEDLKTFTEQDLSEKGYLNTFNHITAQAFMTVLYSEELADFVADAHERRNLPELITGKFSPEQIEDLERGPIDNYVDMINNEWGQELGKRLKEKYKIHRQTNWTPQLLANFLNDVQSYYSWAFQIGFKPFTKENEKVISFAKKLNIVMNIKE